MHPALRSRAKAIAALQKKIGCPDCAYLWYYYPDLPKKSVRQYCLRCKPQKENDVKVTKPKEEDYTIVETPPPGIKRLKPVPVGKLRRVLATGVPHYLANAKWKTLKQWVTKNRESYREKGEFLTLPAMLVAATSQLGESLALKARRRLKGLLPEEWEQERQLVRSMVESTFRREKEAEERRRQAQAEQRKTQRNSEPLSRVEQKVLDTITRFGQTRKEIRVTTGLKKINATLRKLLKRKLIVKLSPNEFALPKKEKQKNRPGKTKGRRIL